MPLPGVQSADTRLCRSEADPFFSLLSEFFLPPSSSAPSVPAPPRSATSPPLLSLFRKAILAGFVNCVFCLVQRGVDLCLVKSRAVGQEVVYQHLIAATFLCREKDSHSQQLSNADPSVIPPPTPLLHSPLTLQQPHLSSQPVLSASSSYLASLLSGTAAAALGSGPPSLLQLDTLIDISTTVAVALPVLRDNP